MVLVIIAALLIIIFDALFAFLILRVLSARLFGSSYVARDRGCGVFNLGDGMSAMFIPSPSARRTIARYQLFYRDEYENCFFVGEWADEVDSAEYELIAYNSRGSVIDIIRIRENRDERRFTRTQTLPYETDRISLRVRRSDGANVTCGRTFTPCYLIWLAVTAVVASALACVAAYFIFWLAYYFATWQTAAYFTGCGDILTAVGVCVFVLTVILSAMPVLVGWLRTKLNGGSD